MWLPGAGVGREDLTAKNVVRLTHHPEQRRRTKVAKILFCALRALCVLCTIIVQSFRGSRKFSADLNSNTGIYSRQGAKYAKFGEKRRIVYQKSFTVIVRPLRPWRPFDFAQDMLCARYSEFRLRPCRAVLFVVESLLPCSCGFAAPGESLLKQWTCLI